MWIDIINGDGVRPLPDVIADISRLYDSSLKAEMAMLSTYSFDFRHAVCILDEKGKPHPRSPATDEIAGQLLVEYGVARGGTPGALDVESWDFGRCTGYAMAFIGGPTEPTHETRLKGEPRRWNEVLLNHEEGFQVSTEELAVFVGGSAK